MMIEPEFPERETAPLVPSLAAENKILDMRALQLDRWSSTAGYRFKTLAELSADPIAKRWIIKNIFARGETSAWIAPPGAMKSALMAQAALHIACGMDWHGYRNKSPAAGVVYFALERVDLVARRIRAHAKRMESEDGERFCFDQIPLVVSDATIDLTRPDAFRKFIATIRDANAYFETCGLGKTELVIIDTFAKLIAAGGGDENSAKDQGTVFANIQRIKLCEDVHVALVGHTGKDETRGARGSNAILGDVDVMVTIETAGEIKTAKIIKANDAPEGPLFSFKSEIHDFGKDEDGDPITVNIVSSEAVDARQDATHERGPKLTANQKTVFAMLHAAGNTGLTLEEWNAQAKEAGIGIKRKADLTDIHNALLSKGMVRTYNNRWNVCHDS